MTCYFNGEQELQKRIILWRLSLQMGFNRDKENGDKRLQNYFSMGTAQLQRLCRVAPRHG